MIRYHQAEQNRVEPLATTDNFQGGGCRKAAPGAYVQICQFLTRPGLEEEFERIYGPQGAWVRLQQSKGFLCTELNRDIYAKGGDGTVDYLVSQPGFDEFLKGAKGFVRLSSR